MTTETAQATYAEFLAAPDHVTAELIDGRLFMTPRPAGPHLRAATKLGVVLDPLDGAGGWVFLDEPELRFDNPAVSLPDILVPDLAGWRTARFPVHEQTAAFFTVAPDWVCEILSPGTEGRDRARKSDLYARVGVAHQWLINPVTRTLEVRRLDRPSGHWVELAVFTDQAIVRAEPFDLEFALGSLWW